MEEVNPKTLPFPPNWRIGKEFRGRGRWFQGLAHGSRKILMSLAEKFTGHTPLVSALFPRGLPQNFAIIP